MKSTINNTILIIDNDEFERTLLSNSLEKLNYKVYSISGCVRALSKAISIKPDLILLATMLKNQNGFEIGRALKSNQQTESIPIIYLKCPNDKVDYNIIFAFGGVDVVTKPVEIKELQSRINFQLKLNENRKELSRQVSEREELFSILSHDLRKPFASLIGLTQLLAESTHFCTLDEIKDLAKENHKTVQNTYHLLENLLEWCKVKSGQIEFKPAKLNLTELIEKVAFQSREYALGKNISIQIKVNSKSHVFADERMIYTVLKNLTENAIKFSPPYSEVIVKQHETLDLEEVTIKDHGVGIKKNDMPKLFKISNPFTTPGTANEIGSGLGLILSKELIQKNGGELSFKSKYKAGSSFTFALPKIAI